jgi:LysR family D-serine deaminase transcriptional activator
MARQSFVAEQLATSRLVSPFDMTVNSAHSYYVVCRKDMQTSPKIKAFKDWLLSEIYM